MLSQFFVHETQNYAQLEAQLANGSEASGNDVESNNLSFKQVFSRTSWKDKSLFSASQAGMINNLNDGMVWGLAPLLLVGAGLALEWVAIIAAIYPTVWGLGQLFTGALSDRWGRKWLIVAGMWLQAVGIGLFVVGHEVVAWMGAAMLLGFGTAMV